MFEINPETLIRLISVVPAILVAASFHEFAHGWMAHRLGDDTAKLEGRLTLNPIKHIDPIGTVIVPLFLALMPGGFMFGWAKPVPVNPYNLRNPKTDMAWVAAAGPISNFMQAFSAVIFLKFLSFMPAEGAMQFVTAPLTTFFFYYLFINIILGIFNLIPIPPLDGGRIMVGLLPNEHAARWAQLEPYGMMIVVILFILDPFGLWGKVLGPLIKAVVGLFAKMAGF